MPGLIAQEVLSEGRLAVITGGASGIGLACARHFLDAGMRVCLMDADESALFEAFPQDRYDSDQVGRYRVDVAKLSEVAAAAQAIANDFGPVSLLMNNAGMSRGGDVFAEPEIWERLIGVNLMGVLYCVNAFVPRMIAGGQPGIVINTGSKQGLTQPPGNTAYNVTKSGVKALTEGLAHSLREAANGRMSAHLLIPGFTFTGMVKKGFPEKPPAAWEPERVAQFMVEALLKDEFYILCPDNETPPELDRKRIAWATGDIIENRPALSRWHPDYKEKFEKFLKDD